MYRLIVVILLYSLLSSCSNSENTSDLDFEKTFRWDVHGEDSSPFNSIVFDYVILRNEPADKIIGAIEKIISYNDEFYIKSKDKLNVYDESGQYLRTIGGRGNAGFEYIDFIDFSIYDSIVYVLDYSQSSLLSYKLNGHFIDKKRTPISHLSGVLAVNNGFVFYRPRYKGEISNNLFESAITFTDLDLNILKQELVYNDNSPTVSNYPAFVESEEMGCFHQFLTDNFLQLNRKDATKTFYGFDFLSEKIQPNEIHNYEVIYSDNGNKRFFNCTPIVLNQWILGRSVLNQKGRIFAVNINSGIIYEDDIQLNIFSNTIGFHKNNLLIPYELCDQNMSYKSLPDSIQDASERGNNIIIKAYIND